MRKKMSQEDFIKKVKSVYGDFFDYSKVEYRGAREKIILSSDKYGEEKVFPGSLFCYDFTKRKRKKERGKRIGKLKSHQVWRGVMSRCSHQNKRNQEKAYTGCEVCEEWKNFETFRIWFDKNYIPGYQIDKDIIKKGNKVYCPEFCCFVPQKINLLVKTRGEEAAKRPPGIRETSDGKYEARIFTKKKQKKIGTFDTINLAFAEYKKEKEARIRQTAQEYYDAGKIERRVYDALMSYEVQITD